MKFLPTFNSLPYNTEKPTLLRIRLQCKASAFTVFKFSLYLNRAGYFFSEIALEKLILGKKSKNYYVKGEYLKGCNQLSGNDLYNVPIQAQDVAISFTCTVWPHIICCCFATAILEADYEWKDI